MYPPGEPRFVLLKAFKSRVLPHTRLNRLQLHSRMLTSAPDYCNLALRAGKIVFLRPFKGKKRAQTVWDAVWIDAASEFTRWQRLLCSCAFSS